jgi:endonuclease/exonuclease/phosphatase family metal-dependent hydrolase
MPRSFPKTCVQLLIVAAALGLVLGLSACNRKARTNKILASGAMASFKGGPGGPISIDGDLGEWPAERSAVADSDFFYFRVGIGEPEATLQASMEPLTVLVDVDGNARTGLKSTESAAATGLGADLIVQFSPVDAQRAGPGRGVKVFEVDRQGVKRELPKTQATITFGPTHSSEWFEVRLSRGTFTKASTGRVMSVLRDGSGAVLGWSEPESFAIPPGNASPALKDAELPAKPEGALRIVSYNVLLGAPMKTPAPYARVLEALDPDVVLVQEWNEVAAEQLEAWFNATVPLSDGGRWHALTTEGRGVAVVSRLPVEALGPSRLVVEGDTRNTNAVRFAGGLIQTPIGGLAVGSVHLKSRGSKGSPEDQRRMAEAEIINSTWQDALAGAGEVPIRVIGGDMNLVGSQPPLLALASGLDADGSELAIATPRVLGDGSAYTWCDPKTDFCAGRLDYFIYSDATVQAINEFSLDTTRLTEATLATMGLDRSDSKASDHLPLVIDLVKK